ncbi:EAL domain-containing protein [Cardiobacteriaceae bacterium TAE3-ERU3]|nr:EAL domain-containing protein [Cardiobacteriaceae bacterium TAE3-ERU3]
MNSYGTLEHCKIILVSQNMEWNHIFFRNLKSEYVVEEQTCDQVWQVKDLLKKDIPDILIMVGNEAENVLKLKKQNANVSANIPILAVTEKNCNDFIKAGADYCIKPVDILSAVKHTVQVIEDNKRLKKIDELKCQCDALSQLNNALYQYSPDPLCYIQDGLFIDANKAFLDCFAIKDKSELDDLTLLSLVTPKSEKALKILLKTASGHNLSASDSFEIQTQSGTKKTLQCTASQVNFYGEEAVQLNWREVNQAGGVAVSTDRTTGLMGFSAIQQLLANQRKDNKSAESLGIWIFLWLENYREIWGQDGYDAAELLMHSVAKSVTRFMPPSTIATRFNDDCLILLAQGERHVAIERMEKLITQLQGEIPEGIDRMVHPEVYTLVDTVSPEMTDSQLLSSSFRAVKALSMSQSQDHLTTGNTNKLSRNDERKILQLQKIIDDQRLKVKYLPISHLEADGVPRFGVELDVELDADQGDDFELDSLVAVAERQNMSKVLDELKVNAFIQDVLCFDGNQRAINGYIGLTSSSVQDQTFVDWLISQFKQTGIAPEQATFEITLDTALNTFSGALNFTNNMRKYGSHVAITEIGRFDDDVKELLEKIGPDVLKLDMREIDTFEDEEEERFMAAVKNHAEEYGQTIIVDYMESPAQLSRVWPYDLQLLQGEGMVSAVDSFEYDFSEPLF